MRQLLKILFSVVLACGLPEFSHAYMRSAHVRAAGKAMATLPPAWRRPVADFLTSNKPNGKELLTSLQAIPSLNVENSWRAIESHVAEQSPREFAQRLAEASLVMAEFPEARFAPFSEMANAIRDELSDDEVRKFDAAVKRTAKALGASTELAGLDLDASPMTSISGGAKALPSAWKLQPAGKIIGATRGEGGAMKVVRSRSTFVSSQRDLSGSTFGFLGGWNPEREATVVPLAVQGLPASLRTELKTAESWSALPADLRALFEGGQYLVTAGQEVRQPSEYSLLMYAAEGTSSRSGRSGFLLKDGQPVTIQIDGNDFLVELKGSGTPSGGFEDDENTIAGGIPFEYARREIEMIEARRGTKSYAAGRTMRGLASLAISPTQGYIVRLSPGSLRLSYGGNRSLSRIEAVEGARFIGEELGRVFAKGLVPGTHPENFVVLPGNQGLALTDNSDVFRVEEFPRELEGSELDPYGAISNALDVIDQLPGKPIESHAVFEAVREGLIKGLQEDKSLGESDQRELEQATDTSALARTVWRKILFRRVFEARKRSGWVHPKFAYAMAPRKESTDESISRMVYWAQSVLRKEINTLDEMRQNGPADIRDEVSRNLKIAILKYAALQASPSELRGRIEADKDYLFASFFLPYYTNPQLTRTNDRVISGAARIALEWPRKIDLGIKSSDMGSDIPNKAPMSALFQLWSTPKGAASYLRWLSSNVDLKEIHERAEQARKDNIRPHALTTAMGSLTQFRKANVTQAFWTNIGSAKDVQDLFVSGRQLAHAIRIVLRTRLPSPTERELWSNLLADLQVIGEKYHRRQTHFDFVETSFHLRGIESELNRH